MPFQRGNKFRFKHGNRYRFLPGNKFARGGMRMGSGRGGWPAFAAFVQQSHYILLTARERKELEEEHEREQLNPKPRRIRPKPTPEAEKVIWHLIYCVPLEVPVFIEEERQACSLENVGFNLWQAQRDRFHLMDKVYKKRGHIRGTNPVFDEEREICRRHRLDSVYRKQPDTVREQLGYSRSESTNQIPTQPFWGPNKKVCDFPIDPQEEEDNKQGCPGWQVILGQ